MFVFLLSLLGLIAPVPAAAPEAVPKPAFAWIDGTWRTDALEMKCVATANGASCHEEGRSEAMRGASADLVFAAAGAGAQLTVALPSIPASVFTQVSRDERGAVFEMKTRSGVARLRFTRTGEQLKIERGNADGWATTMSYRRG